MKDHHIDHPDAVTVWQTRELRKGDYVDVLMVETKLIHDPNREGYDEGKFESLKSAASKYAETQKHIDIVIFHTIGDP